MLKIDAGKLGGEQYMYNKHPYGPIQVSDFSNMI